MKKIAKFIKVISITLLSVGTLVYSEKTTQSIVRSIGICLEIIIPSTFIFMVISTYILSSGLYLSLFKPIYTILKKIFKTNRQIISVFLLSLIGGYPVGFKLLKELIAENKNYSAIADYCAAFSYCISPSFAVTMIGCGLYKSIDAGIIVYISNVISCLLIALLVGINGKLKLENCHSDNTYKNTGLTEAISSSVVSLAKMCSVIIFFNASIMITECFLENIGIIIPISLKSILEISNVLNFKNMSPSALPYISSLASFGGFCVLLQCKSLINNSFSLKFFMFTRFLAAFLSFISTKLILIFWDISFQTITSDGGIYVFDFSINKAATVFLILMCIILMKKSEKNFKKG